MRYFLAAIVVLIALASSGAAFAHAALIGTVPADGDVLAVAPKTATLRFTEPVSPLVLKLVVPDGSSTPLTDFTVTGTSVDIGLPAVSAGTRTLSWRVVSQDGHPIGGSLVFSVGAPTVGGIGQPAEAVDWPLRAAIWFTRTGLYAALFFGIGGLFFRRWIVRGAEPSRGRSLALLGIGLVAAPFSIALQGLDALALPLGAIVNFSVWQAGFSTSLGPAMAIAFCALLLAALSLRIFPRLLVTLALGGIGLSLAASGHAGAADPQWLTRPAVFVHAVTIAFWAGALLPLAGLLAGKSPAAVLALRRFSAVIPFALGPLILAGAALAIIQLGSFEALWRTPYGLVFLAKLALLAAVFILAVHNRFGLTMPAIAGDITAGRDLVRAIVIETFLILAIFAIVAFWRFTPPPRVLAEIAALPASVHIHTDKAMAEVTVTPGHVGPVSVSVFLMSGDFGALDAQGVQLVLSNPGAGIEPFQRPAEKQPDGTWRVDDLTIPVAGLWMVRLDIRVSDFVLIGIEEKIEIRP